MRRICRPSSLRATLAVALFFTPLLGAETPTVDVLSLADGEQSPRASIGELSWLAGYWRGSGLGGDCEELWTEPIGDRMMGLFHLAREGEAVFSEHMMLVETGGSLALYVKHFSGDFVAWEDKEGKVVFPLVRMGERTAWFSGLTLHQPDPDSLIVVVRLHRGESVSDERFVFERIRVDG